MKKFLVTATNRSLKVECFNDFPEMPGLLIAHYQPMDAFMSCLHNLGEGQKIITIVMSVCHDDDLKEIRNIHKKLYKSSKQA